MNILFNRKILKQKRLITKNIFLLFINYVIFKIFIMINVIVNNIISKILISYVNIFQEKIQIFIISIFKFFILILQNIF